MPKIKAIVFDLDNTLIDFMKMKQEACKSALKAMIKRGLKVKFGPGYKKLMGTYFKVGIESNTAFQHFLKEETGHIDDKILAGAINAYLKAKEKFLKPYPKVKLTLSRLKKSGLKLAIVTDAPRLKAFQRLEAMGIESYFDFVIGIEDTGKGKISIAPFKLAMKKLDLKPQEILLVSDSVKKDIMSAKRLGIKTVLAKYGQIEKDKGAADYKIDNISEILSIVKG